MREVIAWPAIWYKVIPKVNMPGPFVHNIDPIIGRIDGLYLWWYGASYTLGFLAAFFWTRGVRHRLNIDLREVYSLSILLALSILIGGRTVEVVFYEWPYYVSHPWHILAIWLGGMSTHGILIGAVIGTWLFCKLYDRKFLPIADELVIAGALIMGIGRIGNFIDGQISGSVTDVWWGVKFPDLDGFRHPVVLYDGLKNLLLVPVLIFIRSFHPPPGVVFGHFVLWYGCLRIFVDLFREYRTDFLGFPPGQGFNISMSLVGLSLILWAYKAEAVRTKKERVMYYAVTTAGSRKATWPQRCIFTILLIVPLVIPSDWTQDVPKRYGKRHEGLTYSLFYPRISSELEIK